MRIRFKHTIIVCAVLSILATVAVFLSSRFDAESFSVRIDSAEPLYDGFDIQTTITNDSRSSRRLLVHEMIYELRSGPNKAYVSSDPLDQNVSAFTSVKDILRPRGCPKSEQNDDEFRLVYVLSEPYRPPPKIIHNAYSLLLDRGPPTWFTNMYQPRTHRALSDWFAVPKSTTKATGEQDAASDGQ